MSFMNKYLFIILGYVHDIDNNVNKHVIVNESLSDYHYQFNIMS